jgi:hypothetical protein
MHTEEMEFGLADIEVGRYNDGDGNLYMVVRPIKTEPAESKNDLTRAVNFIGRSLQELYREFPEVRSQIPLSPYTVDWINGVHHATYVFGERLRNVAYLESKLSWVFGH